jgi:phenylalanyl-tRNA synthetase alpha subunit
MTRCCARCARIATGTRRVAETVGWLADKLSIVELKRYHMREQMERTDVAADFRQQCSDKLDVLTRQRDDLAEELAELLADIASGRVVPRVYRQFKMYNDPAYRVSRDRGKA